MCLKPIPTALAQARGTSESRHLLLPGPVPLPPSLTIRRWKTPWTVLKSLLTEQPDPWSGTGQPVAEVRSALRPLPQIKLDCPPLPAPGYRRRTGYPLLLRGELTLDFPLPASASFGGQRSQPSLEPMTDDGPVRPTILPGLGGGGAPSPRSRDASMPALSKNREPNPASVFHRQPHNKPNPNTQPNNPPPSPEGSLSALGGSFPTPIVTPCVGRRLGPGGYTPSGRRARADSMAVTRAIADSGVSSTATLALSPCPRSRS